MDLGVAVSGDRELDLKFQTFPTRAHDALFSRITKLTDRLEGLVRAAAPNKTGKLRSEIHSAVYDDTPSKISGRVFVDDDYAKAGALEYGAKGSAKVSAYSAKLDHAWAHKLASPTEVMIAAHSRHLNLKARRYLRDPLVQMRSDITAELQEAVAEVIGGNA